MNDWVAGRGWKGRIEGATKVGAVRGCRDGVVGGAAATADRANCFALMTRTDKTEIRKKMENVK